jgi:drug/metabolite transporter (DMT)-like permease
MTRRFPIFLFVCLLGFDVVNFLLQKTASNHAQGDGIAYARSLVTHPFLWIALAIGPIHLGVWTRIISRVDISLAYPLTSMSYPLTIFAAQLILHEHLRWTVWVGVVFITTGAAILGPRHGDAHSVKLADEDELVLSEEQCPSNL